MKYSAPHNYILAIIVLTMMTACGPRAFQGKLDPLPEWTFADLDQWQSPIDHQTGSVIYGRGEEQNETLIANRRARADSKAVEDARLRFSRRCLKVAALSSLSDDRSLAIISWAELALPVERFFDPVKNVQHVLVQITRERFAFYLQNKLKSARSSEDRAKLELLLRSTEELFTDTSF